MFMYYAPKGPGTPFAVPPHLAYACDRGATYQTREVMAGPNGSGPGWLFRFSNGAKVYDDRDLKWDNQATIWAPVFSDSGLECYVGRWVADPLDPAKLERPKMLDGHRVTLGDGSVWVAAVARGFDVETSSYYTPLPRTLGYDGKTGKWRPVKVAKEYRRFLELANLYADAHQEAVAADAKTFEFEPIDELAVAALTANYRISHAELSLFEDVYTVTARDALVHCALDFPTIRRWVEKKTEPGDGGAAT